jgi:hypothetical protein
MLFDHLAMDKKLSQVQHQTQLSSALSDLIRGINSPTLQDVLNHPHTNKATALQSDPSGNANQPAETINHLHNK